MAEQIVRPGGKLNFITPDEMAELIPRPAQVTRIRETAQVQLDSTGSGQDEVYVIPAGYEFAARRVTIYIGTADPVTGAIALVGAGKSIAYLRSGTFVEWAQPAYANTIQVPGVQTWGDQQGPYYRNKESFEVLAAGLTPGALLTVVLEGLLRRPDVTHDA